MIKLKKRQEEAFNTIIDGYVNQKNRQLAVMPCGTGKTILASSIARNFNSCLFIVHTQELLQQTVAAFSNFFSPHEIGVLWGKEDSSNCRNVISTIQTLSSRLSVLEDRKFDLVVVDEAHHYGSKKWNQTLESIAYEHRLGLTATPQRLDGTPLSDIFDTIAYEMTIRDGISEGYLSSCRGLAIHSETDLSGIAIRNGDFAIEALSQRVNTAQRNNSFVTAYLENSTGKKAVAFCVDIQHAKDVAAAFQAAGVRADYIYGDDPDRVVKLEKLKNGDIDLLANCAILTEGWDEPSVETVLLMRPTRSKTLYTQIVGRGLRLYPGKEYCLVIESADNGALGSLVNVWDFYGIRIKKRAEGHVLDLEHALQEQMEQDELLAETFKETTGKKLNLKFYIENRDLLQGPPEVQNLPDYGAHSWHYELPTDRQLTILEEAGYDTINQKWTKGQASGVINKLPATTRQLALLAGLHYDIVAHKWTRQEAAFVLDKSDPSKADWSFIDKLIVPSNEVRTGPVPTAQADDKTITGAITFKCRHTVTMLLPNNEYHRTKMRQYSCPHCLCKKHNVQLSAMRGASPSQIVFGRTVWLKALSYTTPSEITQKIGSIIYASWWAGQSKKRVYDSPAILAGLNPDAEEQRIRYVEPLPTA